MLEGGATIVQAISGALPDPTNARLYTLYTHIPNFPLFVMGYLRSLLGQPAKECFHRSVDTHTPCEWAVSAILRKATRPLLARLTDSHASHKNIHNTTE